MKTISSIVIITASFLFITRIAFADSGPLPHIHSLIQNGQDIKITLAIPDDSYLLVEDPHTLFREQDGESETVFRNRVFANSKEEVSNYKKVCVTNHDFYPEADCTKNPEECFDCNDDGTLECDADNYCDWYGLFDLVDGCVSPGETNYTIQNKF